MRQLRDVGAWDCTACCVASDGTLLLARSAVPLPAA